MNKEQYKYIQNHQAIWQQQGFDYQFAVFLCKLMSCSLHDKVIYEREEDIVIEKESGITQLIQVKHTYKDNEIITNSSTDIWKTIKNWYEWIYTYQHNKKDLNNMELYIITNKQNENKNELLRTISNVQRGDAQSSSLKDTITKFKDKRYSKDICEELLTHEERILPFLMKVRIKEVKDPFEEMFEQLELRSLKGYDITDAFEQIIGRMVQLKTNFKGNEFSFTVEYFLEQFRDIFQKLLLKELTPVEVDYVTPPDNYNSSVMVKQLLSIDAIDKDDKDDIELIIAYKNYFCYLNSLDAYMLKEHIITTKTKRQLDNKFVDVWKLIQKRAYRGCKEDVQDIKERGYNCYTTTMEQDVSCNGTNIIKPFSSGWFLNLSNSDSPSVYWRKDWNEYYKNEKL